MIHVGIDDTDSLLGMCTTYLAVELAADLDRAGFGLVSPPRLVRLNPMIELKTRGNAAVSLRISPGRAGGRWCGTWAGERLGCGRRGRERASAEEIETVERVVRSALERRADVANGANPGYVVCPRAPPASLYRSAVTRFVPMSEALRSLPPGSSHGGWNGALGVVGAAAACAWPARRRTWELIAFRREAKWGSPRAVDEESARRLHAKFPETFNNYDERERRMLITPRSPCPVLFGIRAVRPGRLRDAARCVLAREDWDTCVLFESNQGTGDHLVRARVGGMRPGTCVETRGLVASAPRAIRGGAVIFSLAGGRGRVDCVAYEPTRGFRETVRALRPGDRVVVRGGVRASPEGINLESLDVLSVVRRESRNPRCLRCRRSMESAGRGQGFRCSRCGARRRSKVRAPLERSLAPGRYEVPPCAMRHLHRPIGLQLQ